MDVADLTKGMEHMRPYVSVDSSAAIIAQEEKKLSTASSTSNPQGQQSETEQNHAVNPSHDQPAARSRSPSNPNHRADPSKFGSRYLKDGDDIFEFNAWDSVPITSEFLQFAEQQYSNQRSHPVNEFDRQRFNNAPEKWWDKFYANNSANFFKDRKWLFKEFKTLRNLTSKDAGPLTVLEVGCGAGNTAFPLLQENENQQLMLHCCDFSKAAVDVVRQSPMFNPDCMRADVWDVASVAACSPESDTSTSAVNLPPGLSENSVDLVFLVFVFSALSPSQWLQALRNINAVLKPGGEILFRDYGRGDLAQVRFKKGRWMSENFYVRGDGTRVYFFDKDELGEIFSGKKHGDSQVTTEDTAERRPEREDIPHFDTLELQVDRRMLVNRQRRLKMYRCWLQARFKKPIHQ